MTTIWLVTRVYSTRVNYTANAAFVSKIFYSFLTCHTSWEQWNVLLGIRDNDNRFFLHISPQRRSFLHEMFFSSFHVFFLFSSSSFFLFQHVFFPEYPTQDTFLFPTCPYRFEKSLSPTLHPLTFFYHLFTRTYILTVLFSKERGLVSGKYRERERERKGGREREREG